VENVARIQENRNTYGAFVGKYGGRKETTCKTYAWVVGENITLHLNDVGWESVDWINQNQDL